jgi:hypothetical protein
MLVLACGCVLAGVVPVVVIRPAMAVTGMVMGASGTSLVDPVRLPDAAVSMSGAWVLLVSLGALLWYVRRRARRVGVAAQSATWGCAYAEPTSRMQYTAQSFTAPLLLAFGRIAAPEVERDATSFRTRARDRVLDGLVGPLWRRTKSLAGAFRPLQQGPVTRYLQYIVLTVLLLLGAVFASIVRRP